MESTTLIGFILKKIFSPGTLTAIRFLLEVRHDKKLEEAKVS